MTTLIDVQYAARDWKGVTYTHQGRSREGIDCAGLLVMVARDLGIPYKDRTDYPRRPRDSSFHDFIKDQMPTSFGTRPAPGLAGFFRQGPLVCHCGIFVDYMGELRLVHAFSRRRRVTEDNYEGTTEWPRLLVDVRAFPGTV